jgi:hypothetical protein
MPSPSQIWDGGVESGGRAPTTDQDSTRFLGAGSNRTFAPCSGAKRPPHADCPADYSHIHSAPARRVVEVPAV